MNRRQFVSVLGAGSAASILGIQAASAEPTTPLFVRGLVMLSFEDPKVLRLGFPKAPGHKAVLSVVAQNGIRRTTSLKGHGQLETSAVADGQPRIFVPELVRMNEFYGDAVRSRFESCPSLISIPMSAIASITTHQVSEARWTFVRSDNGQEVTTFRPRQLAESVKIELRSPSTLKMSDAKVFVPVDTVREIWTEYIPDGPGQGGFEDHFGHYLAYVDKSTGAAFDVMPKKVGRASSAMPAVGNQFMMEPFPICFLIAFFLGGS